MICIITASIFIVDLRHSSVSMATKNVTCLSPPERLLLRATVDIRNLRSFILIFNFCNIAGAWRFFDAAAIAAVQYYPGGPWVNVIVWLFAVKHKPSALKMSHVFLQHCCMYDHACIFWNFSLQFHHFNGCLRPASSAVAVCLLALVLFADVENGNFLLLILLRRSQLSSNLFCLICILAAYIRRTKMAIFVSFCSDISNASALINVFCRVPTVNFRPFSIVMANDLLLFWAAFYFNMKNTAAFSAMHSLGILLLMRRWAPFITTSVRLYVLFTRLYWRPLCSLSAGCFCFLACPFLKDFHSCSHSPQNIFSFFAVSTFLVKHLFFFRYLSPRVSSILLPSYLHSSSRYLFERKCCPGLPLCRLSFETFFI